MLSIQAKKMLPPPPPPPQKRLSPVGPFLLHNMQDTAESATFGDLPIEEFYSAVSCLWWNLTVRRVSYTLRISFELKYSGKNESMYPNNKYFPLSLRGSGGRTEKK